MWIEVARMSSMVERALTFLAVVVLTLASQNEKRILLNGDTNAINDIATLQHEVQSLQASVLKLTQENVELKTNLSQVQTKGSVYTRWGRTTCSGPDTALVYEGYAGGSWFLDPGAAANYVCLTREPQWSHYEESIDVGGRMYGAEYQPNDYDHNGMIHFFGKHLFQEDVPCAVCNSPRSATLMIPGRLDCVSGWTKEYSGYLMAGDHTQAASSEYVCVDNNPEAVPGGHANENGKLLYFVDAQCGTLQCPPYVQGRELTCVVCSK